MTYSGWYLHLMYSVNIIISLFQCGYSNIPSPLVLRVLHKYDSGWGPFHVLPNINIFF